MGGGLARLKSVAMFEAPDGIYDHIFVNKVSLLDLEKDGFHQVDLLLTCYNKTWSWVNDDEFEAYADNLV